MKKRWKKKRNRKKKKKKRKKKKTETKENKRRYNEYGDKLSMGKRGEWHHAASIPFNIWEQWMKDTNGAIEKDSKLLARYLNDPDNKFFKVAPTNI